MNYVFLYLFFMMASLPIASGATEPLARNAKTPRATIGTHMRVEVVSGVGSLCPTQCPRWIAMEGRITAETVADVVEAITEVSPDPPIVVINSSGGDLAAALTIGRMLRQFDAMVIVGHTIFPQPRTAQASDEASFHASQRPVGTCLSACVYLLAGGSRRLAGEHTRVGVHRPVEVTRLLTETPSLTAPVVGDMHRTTRVTVSKVPISETAPLVMELHRYVAEMGIDGSIVTLAIETAPSRMRGLSWSELLQTRLLTSTPIP